MLPLRKDLLNSLLESVICTVLVFASLNLVTAQVRTSSNYQLQSDSVNVGGGYSSSASYQQENTVGEISTGPSASSNYKLRAGYQQMQEVFISIGTTGDVTMDPSLPGLTGGVSNGSTTVTVITDSPSGYRLTFESEGDPAMQRDGGGGTILNYIPGGVSDYTFATAATQAHFGFSPEGADIVQSFLDNGGVCGVGVLDTALSCWDGVSTTAVTVSEGAGSNHPNGATTTLNFRVGIGGSAGVIAGTYTATTTVTALPL